MRWFAIGKSCLKQFWNLWSHHSFQTHLSADSSVLRFSWICIFFGKLCPQWTDINLYKFTSADSTQHFELVKNASLIEHDVQCTYSSSLKFSSWCQQPKFVWFSDFQECQSERVPTLFKMHWKKNSFKAASLLLCQDCSLIRELLFVCFGYFLCFCISLFYDNMWDQQICLLAEL